MPNGRHSIEIKACTVQKSKYLQDTACMAKRKKEDDEKNVRRQVKDRRAIPQGLRNAPVSPIRLSYALSFIHAIWQDGRHNHLKLKTETVFY